MDSAESTIIAIDGPAASGKSTVARRVAAHLGNVYVNSGAMYRAFTRHVLEKGIDCADSEAVVQLLADTEFSCGERDGVGTVAINGDELEAEAMNSPEVNANVSAIAAIPEVRDRLVAEQRAYAARANVVMEGRDIGSVVFPETPHKFYIDASPEVRERRRREQGIEDRIAERDRVDSSRKTAPLTVAEDAVVIDSSTMEIDEVVASVLKRIEKDAPSLEPEVVRRRPVGLFYGTALILWRLIARICFRRDVINPEKLKANGGYFIVANHTSYLDPTLIGSAFPGAVFFLARKTLFKKRFAAWLLTKVHSIPVNQERPEYSSIKKVIQLVQSGERVMIFPEGERTRDGKLKDKGEPGIGLLIAKSRVPILPVRLYGAFEAMPPGASFPKCAKMTLVAGDLIDLNDFIDNSGLRKKELYQALSDRAMEAIAALELPEKI